VRRVAARRLARDPTRSWSSHLPFCAFSQLQAAPVLRARASQSRAQRAGALRACKSLRSLHPLRAPIRSLSEKCLLTSEYWSCCGAKRFGILSRLFSLLKPIATKRHRQDRFSIVCPFATTNAPPQHRE
jgi:hypothetical protein